MEHEIKLDQKDLNRIRRINVALKNAQDNWQDTMKLILTDYLEHIDGGVRIGISSMDFETGVMKIKIDGGDPSVGV